jgi:3-deoxy-7-phosphoheptulonate synthase
MASLVSMVVVLQEGVTPDERAKVAELLAAADGSARGGNAGEVYTALPLGGETVVRLGAPSLPQRVLVRLEALPCVARIVAVTTQYILASRAVHPAHTIVRVGDCVIGGDEPVIIAGPCAVEDEEQIFAAARAAAEAGAHLLRGGAFKPRTSPYSFQGLGLAGLELLACAGKASGLPVITEVMEPSLVETVAALADVLQVGSRNMQNFPLLRAVGRAARPVLLKRGFAATLDEWLLAAEYILAEGNSNVILCERGIRGFDPQTRNLLDLTCVPLLRDLTHLPVLVDPSHATGRRDLVVPMGVAAIAAGAAGLLVEMHPHPDQALSDPEQALSPSQLRTLIRHARSVHAALATSASDGGPTSQPEQLVSSVGR